MLGFGTTGNTFGFGNQQQQQQSNNFGFGNQNTGATGFAGAKANTFSGFGTNNNTGQAGITFGQNNNSFGGNNALGTGLSLGGGFGVSPGTQISGSPFANKSVGLSSSATFGGLNGNKPASAGFNALGGGNALGTTGLTFGGTTNFGSNNNLGFGNNSNGTNATAGGLNFGNTSGNFNGTGNNALGGNLTTNLFGSTGLNANTNTNTNTNTGVLFGAGQTNINAFGGTTIPTLGFNANNTGNAFGANTQGSLGFGAQNSNTTFGAGLVNSGQANTGNSFSFGLNQQTGFNSVPQSTNAFGNNIGFGGNQLFGNNNNNNSLGASAGVGSNLGLSGSAFGNATTPFGMQNSSNTNNAFGTTNALGNAFSSNTAGTSTFGGLGAANSAFGAQNNSFGGNAGGLFSGNAATTPSSQFGNNPSTSSSTFGGFGNLSASKPAFTLGGGSSLGTTAATSGSTGFGGFGTNFGTSNAQTSNPTTSSWNFGQNQSVSNPPSNAFQISSPSGSTFSQLATSNGGFTLQPSGTGTTNSFFPTTGIASGGGGGFNFGTTSGGTNNFGIFSNNNQQQHQQQQVLQFQQQQQQHLVPQENISFDTSYNDLPANYKSEIDKIFKEYKEPTKSVLETIQRNQGRAIDDIYHQLKQLSITLSSLETEQFILEKEVKPFLDELKLFYREFRISSQTGISQIKSRSNGGAVGGGGGSRLFQLLDEELPDKFYIHFTEHLTKRLKNCIQLIKYFEEQLFARMKVLESYRKDMKVFQDNTLHRALMTASSSSTLSMTGLKGGDAVMKEDLVMNRGPYGQLLRVGPNQLLNLIKQQAETYTLVASEINYIHQETNEIKQLFLKFYRMKRSRETSTSAMSAIVEDYNPFELADRKEANEQRINEEKLKLESDKMLAIHSSSSSSLVPTQQQQFLSSSLPVTTGSTALGTSSGFNSTPAFTFAGNSSSGLNFGTAPSSTATTSNPSSTSASSSSVAALDLATTTSTNSNNANPPAASNFGFSFGNNSTANGGSAFGSLNLSVNTGNSGALSSSGGFTSTLGKTNSVTDLTTKKKNKK